MVTASLYAMCPPPDVPTDEHLLFIDLILLFEIVDHGSEKGIFVDVNRIGLGGRRFPALVPVLFVAIGIHQQQVFGGGYLFQFFGSRPNAQAVPAGAMQGKNQACVLTAGFRK